MLTAYARCSSLTVSPPRPMTRPTMPRGTGTSRRTPAANRAMTDCVVAASSLASVSTMAAARHTAAGDPRT